MKHFLAVLLFSIISTFASAKGAQGKYYIVGIAYSPDSISLKNVELTVKFGDKTKIIKTNDQGGFEIEVIWTTPCRSGITAMQAHAQQKKMNPEYIYVSYNGKELKIKNDWKKYTGYHDNKVLKKKDLMY